MSIFGGVRLDDNTRIDSQYAILFEIGPKKISAIEHVKPIIGPHLLMNKQPLGLNHFGMIKTLTVSKFCSSEGV